MNVGMKHLEGHFNSFAQQDFPFSQDETCSGNSLRKESHLSPPAGRERGEKQQDRTAFNGS